MDTIIRDLYVVALGGSGIYLIAATKRFARLRQHCAWIKFDCSVRPRLDAVLEERAQLERFPAWLGACAGVLALALCGALVLGRMSTVTAYALLCASVVSAMSYALLRMRTGSGERRAAVFKKRTPASVIPSTFYWGAALLALSLLGYAPSSHLRLAAIVTSLSVLMALMLSARVATMPSLMPGRDPQMEVYVDSYLRRARAATILNLAYAQVVVLASLTGSQGAPEPLGALVSVAAGVLYCAFTFWSLRAARATNGPFACPTS